MALLGVSKLTKYYGSDMIFADVSFQVNRGEKVGLLGVNGAGKSTLLKIIAEFEQADAGEVHFDRGNRLAYLAQEKRFEGDQTLWQEMEASLSHVLEMQAEIAALEQQMHDTTAADAAEKLERYGDLMARFEHAGGYDMERNILRTLSGLGFTEDQYHQPLTQFSGGQKTRAALASTLLSDPDLLLLDEPTNHLDLEAMEWLEGFLKTWPGTLIVVSHDRHFLEKVTKRTLEMAFGGIEDYPGGYIRYLRLKAERMERRLKEYTAQQEMIAKTEEFIRRYGAGQRSKEARGRETRLNRLKKTGLIERPRDPAKLKLFLDSQLRSGDIVLNMDKIAVGYETPTEKKVLLRANGLEIFRGERIALIGPNGCGKTTLIRSIIRELTPLEGYLRFGHNIDIGYYAQGHEALDYEATVLDEILSVDPTIGETQARTLLGQFLFTGDDVFKQVGDLSGGERSRVALAQLMLQRSNLLIMDEPTNHLDTDAREALESVLRDYKGSLLFVSHDRYLIDALADKIWIARNGVITEQLGNYSDYTARLEKQRQTAQIEAPATASSQTKKAERPSSRSGRPSNEEKQRLKKLAQVEAEVLRLERDLGNLKAELDAASATQDVARITELGKKYVELEASYESRYEEWSTLASEID